MVEGTVISLRRSNDIIFLHFIKRVVRVDSRSVRCHDLLLRESVFDLNDLNRSVKVDLLPLGLFSRLESFDNNWLFFGPFIAIVFVASVSLSIPCFTFHSVFRLSCQFDNYPCKKLSSFSLNSQSNILIHHN